jgi:hypothetical protein
MVILACVADTRDALHCSFVTDVTAERVARVRGIDHDPTGANDLDRLSYQAGLRILGVDFEIVAGHRR